MSEQTSASGETESKEPEPVVRRSGSQREAFIRAHWEKHGWIVIRGGAPDFMMLRLDENGKINEIAAVEVKGPNDGLSYEQIIWKGICDKVGIPWWLEAVL
jgi:hypothetical protein